MPDYVSKKKLKKKVIDRWENEGGNISSNVGSLSGKNPPPKRKRKKDRLGRSLQSA